MEISDELHAPAALPPREHSYRWTRRLCGLRSRSERYGKRQDLPLPGIEPHLCGPSLYRLIYPGSYLASCGEINCKLGELLHVCLTSNSPVEDC